MGIEVISSSFFYFFEKIRMYKYIVLILFCYMPFTGCFRKPKFQYDYYKLQEAWKTNDTTYLRDWVQNFDTLDFVSFANRAAEFGDLTNFAYGVIDLDGDVGSGWSEKEKKVYRTNVIKIYSEYLKTCLFLNKGISYESSDIISDKYWRDSTILTDLDLKNFRFDIEKICHPVGVDNISKGLMRR
jgi:hypothetical protein